MARLRRSGLIRVVLCLLVAGSTVENRPTHSSERVVSKPHRALGSYLIHSAAVWADWPRLLLS
jgi:hypothetical protein